MKCCKQQHHHSPIGGFCESDLLTPASICQHAGTCRYRVSGLVQYVLWKHIHNSYNWYWLIDGLKDAGYQAHLAHPSAMKKYEGLKYTGDFADAAYLAHLQRQGLLPEGYIFPRELRAIRDLERKRMQLVRCRPMQILSIENILARETSGRMDKRQIRAMTAEGIESLGLKSDVTLAMESNRVVCQALQQQIVVLEKRLEAQVKLQTEYQLVKTIPGIGQILATTIMLETGTISRFADVGNFSSYCRCVNNLHESNGNKKGSGSMCAPQLAARVRRLRTVAGGAAADRIAHTMDSVRRRLRPETTYEASKGQTAIREYLHVWQTGSVRNFVCPKSRGASIGKSCSLLVETCPLVKTLATTPSEARCLRIAFIFAVRISAAVLPGSRPINAVKSSRPPPTSLLPASVNVFWTT